MAVILCAIVAAHRRSLPLECVPVRVHVPTDTHSLCFLSPPSVYMLQQSHPSKPVDHEIRLRRTAANDTGAATNENIRMKECRSKTADTVVVTGVGNYISQLPPSFYSAHFSCCALVVRTGH